MCQNDIKNLLSKHVFVFFVVVVKLPYILSVITREHHPTPGSCSLISVINSVHVDDKRDVITASVCAHQS